MRPFEYIRLPPGIHFGISLKGLKLPRLDILGLPLTHRVKILQKIKFGTSHIPHHTSPIAYEFVSLKKISDQNICAVQQLIKTDHKKGF